MSGGARGVCDYKNSDVYALCDGHICHTQRNLEKRWMRGSALTDFGLSAGKDALLSPVALCSAEVDVPTAMASETLQSNREVWVVFLLKLFPTANNLGASA